MTTEKDTKLKRLNKNLKPGTVVLSSWLKQIGISSDLQKYYVNSGWLEALNRGVFKKPDDKINWQGAVYALQQQAGVKVIVGALTSLSLLGFAHYIRFENDTLFLFSPDRERLPKWVTNIDWGNKIVHKQTSFIPIEMALTKLENEYFDILISSPERAILETIFLTPQYIDLIETYHIFEGLVNLRPKVLQELLMACRSVKVKRIFLYMAEKLKHQWFNFLDVDKIDLGKGDRQITPGGVYNSKYKIILPKEIVEL